MTKHRTKDGINYTLHGCVLQVLNINEIIKEDDFIRPLVESPMLSESGGWDKTYKNDKWEGPQWHRVKDDMPYWIGKSYHDFIKHMFKEDYGHYPIEEFIQDEIVRIIQL